MSDPAAGDELEAGEEWPPFEAQVQAAAWEAEHLLERGHYAHAARTVERVLRFVRADERDFFLGLRHLAAAGCRAESSRPESAARQLAHARRRLAAFRPAHREVELEPLLEAVERRIAP